MISKPLVGVLLLLTASVYTINSTLHARRDSKKTKIYIVSKEDNNLAEVENLIKGNIAKSGIHLSTMLLSTELYQGEPEYAAVQQAEESFQKAGSPVLVEVQSLEFDELNGLPGPYIEEFYDKIGNEGLVRLLSHSENKAATMKSVFAYLKSAGGEPQVFVGETKGKIVEPVEIEGSKWDAIFIPEGYNVTMAELDEESKNKVYQRKLALDKFLKYIEKTPHWI